jgi:hypothetical protein
MSVKRETLGGKIIDLPLELEDSIDSQGWKHE